MTCVYVSALFNMTLGIEIVIHIFEHTKRTPFNDSTLYDRGFNKGDFESEVSFWVQICVCLVFV